MEIKRKHLAIGGAILVVAGVVVVGLIGGGRSRPPVGTVGESLRVIWGSAAEKELVGEVMKACMFGDIEAAARYWVGAPNVTNLQPVAAWCEHATQKGAVSAWELDEAATTKDPTGMTILTVRTWRDLGRGMPERTIYWWVKKQDGRWVLWGGN